ncbi:MAG: GHMP kinase [Promethearchaeota archaeon]|nr:MAG: GHMP kinase [Candidatus Lokiarchaeota archaeon]
MNPAITNSILNKLEMDNKEILDFVKNNSYSIPRLPKVLKAKNDVGDSFSIAYSIQGILKYHGLTDWNQRIAYFPSISVNNNSVFTITYLKFDDQIKKDKAYLNGEELKNEKLNRIKKSLDMIRAYSKAKNKAILISRNFCTNNLTDLKKGISDSKIGKGLGTSASGSAALALAAISILYDNDPDYINNERLRSIFSRYLAGSGARSAVGGFGIWFSYPNIDPFDSFAIRLDKKVHKSFIDNISLITIPIFSDIETKSAHKIAPESPFFVPWLKNRRDQIYEFFEGLNSKNLKKIGNLAEFDSLCLHSITMTGGKINGNRLFAWSPKTLRILKLLNDIDDVYYSIDTGPSIVLLTMKKFKDKLIRTIKDEMPQLKILDGKIGGPSRVLKTDSFEAKLLKDDFDKYIN